MPAPDEDEGNHGRHTGASCCLRIGFGQETCGIPDGDTRSGGTVNPVDSQK